MKFERKKDFVRRKYKGKVCTVMKKLFIFLSLILALTLVGCGVFSVEGRDLSVSVVRTKDQKKGKTEKGFFDTVASLFVMNDEESIATLAPLEEIRYEEVIPDVIENMEEETEWLLDESLRLDEMLDLLDEFPEVMTVEEVKEEINVTVEQMLEESLYLDGVIEDLENLAF